MAKNVQSEMPFLDHLEELRWRLMWSAVALVIGIAVAVVVILRFDVLTVLTQPVTPYLDGHRLVYTNPGEPLRVIMMLAFGLGLVFAFPVIAYQIWAFVSPALYTHEKRVVVPVLVGAAALFLGGVWLSFRYVMPITLGFLLGLQSTSLDPMITVGEYFSFAMGMSLAFGAVCELPIVVLLLTALGLVTPSMLQRFRRYAAVGSLVTGALITPGGDPFSLLALALPVYLLYELSILLSVLVHRARERRARRLEAEQRIGATA